MLFKDAKSPDDFKQVIDEFKQATRLAPWWPEARYNWALAWEAAGKYATAIDNLKLYQLFKLPEAEARTVQDKIYALEAKQEKATREAAKEKAAKEAEANAKKSSPADDWLKKLDGARYIYCPGEGMPDQMIDIRDGMLIRSAGSSPNFGLGKEFSRWAIHGRIVDAQSWGVFKINEDGESIKEDHPYGDPNPPFTFRRQR